MRATFLADYEQLLRGFCEVLRLLQGHSDDHEPYSPLPTVDRERERIRHGNVGFLSANESNQLRTASFAETHDGKDL